MPRLFRWLVASAILAAPIVSSAQVGVTTDIITGVVTDAGGRPLPGVTIEVLSLETQILRTTQTDSRGRYNVLFPDGGGQYRVTAKMIGMLPRETTLVRYADEDRLEWNVALTDQAFMMEEIAVEARLTPVRVPNAPAPGGLEGVIAGDLAFNLPISTEDLNLLAALAPGVVSVDATDSTDLAFSILGQGPEANNITLDGLSFASGLLPQEGLRVTRVVTNTYDVSRGRFSGGLVSSVSRSGANRVQGSMNYSLRDDALAFQSEQAGSIFRGTIDQHQLSGGFGGPLVRNRLFAYASAQGRLRSDRLSSLSVATFTDLNRLGVAADSVSRFESIVGTLGATDGTIVDDNRSNDLGAALLRIDYLASNNHTLTLRADWRTTDQHPTGVANTSLPESGGTSSTDGGGLMVSVASRIGLHFINEAKAYVSVSRRNSEPFVYLPAGRVRVASMMGDSAAAFQTLTFGGNSRMPSNSETITTEVSQELSWMPAGGAHRVRMGGLIHTETLDNHTAVNQLGTFTFNSLTQLEQSTPVRFTRTLAPTEQRSSTLEWAAYIGDVFRPNRNTQVTFGIRAEGNRLGDAPLYNPDLDAAFGIRTDRLPTEFDLSPRVGFSLMLGTSSNRFVRPSIILRGGAGRFRSPLPINLAAQVAAATGMSDAGLTLTCVGALVPTPDWQRYLVEESSIPSTCDGGPSLTSTFVPSAASFAEDFGAPKTWRASLGFQKTITPLISLSVDATYLRGVSQYGFRDLNLRAQPSFRIAAEDNRPVYVAPGDIVPSTGATRLADSRIDPAFAQVMEISSDLESETKQFTASLRGVTRNGIVLQTSYTYANVRDQSSQAVRRGGRGGLGGNSTAGNPNEFEWARSSFERRHSILVTIRYPFGANLEITGIGRLTSGRPFTPMVDSDINGDGARNDRAYISDPNTVAPGSGVADGLDVLFAHASDRVQRCLTDQFGTVAARNSCTGPWEGSFDIQINYRPTFLGLARRVSVSITTSNLLRGVDELLHGADDLRGWGLRARTDQTLLVVEGFNSAANSYVYSVNNLFGTTRSDANAFRQPFQIGIQVRANFGPNRGQQALDRMRSGGGGGGGGRGGFDGGGRGDRGGPGFARGERGGDFRGGRGDRGRGGGGLDPQEFLRRLRNIIPNPALIVLEMSDSLRLTDAQRGGLDALRSTFALYTDSIASVLQGEIDEYGTNQDQRGLVQILRNRLLDARDAARRTLEDINAILTENQWEMLPERLKNFGRVE